MTNQNEYLNIAKVAFNFLSRYPKPILEKLVSKIIISEKDIKDYGIIFEHYKISLNKPDDDPIILDPIIRATKCYSPQGYFDFGFNNWDRRKTALKEEIQNSFKSKLVGDEREYLYVSFEQINEFLEKYKDHKGYGFYWDVVSRQTNIPWNNELITKHRDFWVWIILHQNPSVNWNFELIDSNLDYVNWAYISSYKFLKWTKDLLIKYKDYLIFSNTSSLFFEKTGKNKKGKEFKIADHYIPWCYGNYYPNLKGSISLSESIDWSIDIIDCLLDYWDWKELSSNESICWDEYMIDYYSQKLDFKELSSNSSVKWDEKLIEKYLHKWDWEKLSGNHRLPWSYDFIEKYENKWYWKMTTRGRIEDETNFDPSISTDEGIIWDIKMLSKWKDQIDFWRIARRGKITDSALEEFHPEFNRKELVDWEFHKFSDCYATEEIFRTGWENFSLNKHFNINKNNIEFLYRNRISLTYSVGNLAWYGHGNYETKDFRLLEILKGNTVLGISLSELIENEIGWTQILINENYINDTVWERLIEPLFIKGLYINYLKMLITNIDSIR